MKPALRLVVALAVASAGADAAAEPHVSASDLRRGDVRRAVVVAFNGAHDDRLPALRYADDDGLRWAETLQRLDIATTLLTVADAETAASGSPLLAHARPPTLASLRAAVDEVAQQLALDRVSGRGTDALFVYVGHGRTDERGRAFLTLADGRLDRATLYSQVVDRLEADYVHVVVDACHASGVVGSRGDANPAILRQLQGTLEREQLSARPRVGAVFAESDTGETHEWSRLRAGVFSHALRSALLGAGDVNGDGRIEYSELDAFVAAALARVPSARARLAVRAMPPAQEPRRALAGPAPHGPRLTLQGDRPYERLWIEDDAGVRLVDLHRRRPETVTLALPPRPFYWLRTPDGEARVTPRELDGGPTRLRETELASRGPTEDAFHAGLFAAPFTRSFYDGYIASSGMVAVTFEQPEPTLAPPPLPDPSPLAASSPTPPPLLAQSTAAGGRHRAAAPVPLEHPVPASVELEEPPLVARRLSDQLELSMALSSAPANAPGLLVGPSVSWRSATRAFRYGVKGSYGYGGGRFDDEEARFHRVSALVQGAVEATTRVAPFVEVGLGWALLAVARDQGTQGDALIPSGRASAGLSLLLTGSYRLRSGAFAAVDLLQVNDHRQLTAFYGVETGLSF